MMLRDYVLLPAAVRILCLGSLINRAGSFVVIFLTIYASEQLGFGIQFATGCMGVLGLGSVIGALIGGHLADRYGRRIVMLAALFGGAVMLLVIGTVSSHWAFMVTVGLFALVNDMYRPAASAMIADLTPIDRRPHAFALMYISINLGFAIAPPIGGLLAELSFTWLFAGDALTMSLYGLIILFTIRETLPQKELEGMDGDQSPSSLPIAQTIRIVASDKTFVLYCAATLLMGIVFLQGVSTLPIYIRSSGLSNLQFGLLMSINGLMIFLLQLPVTHLLSRFRAISIVVAGGTLIGSGFGLTSFTEGPIMIGLAIAVWTLGEIVEAPYKQAIAADMAPVELRATYMGTFSTCFALAITIGAPVGGQILSRFGPAALWTSCFVVAMIAIVFYLTIHRSVNLRTMVA